MVYLFPSVLEQDDFIFFMLLTAADACGTAPGAGRGMTSTMECGSLDPNSLFAEKSSEAALFSA